MNIGIITPSFLAPSIRLWASITAAGAVAGVASILGFFGAYNWLLDLCSHFRVQYFLGLSVVAMLHLLIPRQRRLAACFGALAVVNLVVILPLYLGRTPAPACGSRV